MLLKNISEHPKITNCIKGRFTITMAIVIRNILCYTFPMYKFTVKQDIAYYIETYEQLV